MDFKVIQLIIDGSISADIAKNTKAGVDQDYTIKITKHDPYTGEDIPEVEYINCSSAWLEQEIQETAVQLKYLQAFKELLSDKGIPVLADYSIESVKE